MDVIKELRKAYVEFFASQGIQAYDRYLPDDEVAGTYIIISSQDDTEQLDKCDNGHQPVVTLDFIHKTNQNSGGVLLDTLVEMTYPIIKSDGLMPYITAGLTLISGSSRKVGDTTQDGLSDVFRVYRRILRIQHIIKEN